MSKKKSKIKLVDVSKENTKRHFNGIGYHIPDGYTQTQVQALFREWNNKLQKSGHKDIERFSSVHAGLSSPYLRGTYSSKVFKSHNDPSEALDFARTYLNLYMQTSQARWLYGKDHQAALFLLDCYINQVEFRDIAKLRATQDKAAFVALYPFVDFPTYFDLLKLGKSHYWAYNKTRKILNNCWLWHITDINGEIEPKALELYGFIGLDVKGTTTKYNEALQALGLPPINLRIPEAKY